MQRKQISSNGKQHRADCQLMYIVKTIWLSSVGSSWNGKNDNPRIYIIWLFFALNRNKLITCLFRTSFFVQFDFFDVAIEGM